MNNGLVYIEWKRNAMKQQSAHFGFAYCARWKSTGEISKLNIVKPHRKTVELERKPLPWKNVILVLQFANKEASEFNQHITHVTDWSLQLNTQSSSEIFSRDCEIREKVTRDAQQSET